MSSVMAADAQGAAPNPADLPVPPGDLPPLDPGPDGAPAVAKEPSLAQPIAPLPAVDPGPDGRVAIDRQPIAPNPPVRPAPLDLPTRPAQELVDATSADALATLGRAGRLTVDGKPDLDATKLQPQVSSAQVFDPSRKATLKELVDALASGNIPPPLPVDPLALLNELPDGIPRITYRICSESKTKAVSCSITLPLAVPAIVDVTGDRTPDVLADLIPAAAVGDIVGVSREILDLERQIEAATSRLNAVLELLKDPLNLILHPNLLLEKLQLETLLKGLNDTLRQKLEALLNLVHVGLGVLSVRLPTSEYAGKDLPAHVWAVYDLPTRKRISVGFDGFRRGSSLPTATLGLYTFNPLQAMRGIFDIKASLLQVGAGESMAVTAGLANVAETDKGEAYDPTVASARFSPVPGVFTAHAFIDPGAADRDQKATVDSTSSVRTHLDAQVLSNSRMANPPTDRFDQLKVDTLPTRVSAALTRPAGGARATVDYTADSSIDDVFFADYVYSGQTLNRAVQAGAKAVPAQWKAVLTSGQDKVKLDYTAASRLSALDVAVFDRAPAIVLRGALRDIPTAATVDADITGRHVLFDASDALGSAEVFLARNLGAFAPLGGDHATMVLNGDKLGVSARVTGLKKIDIFFGDHPRGSTEFTPGGQAFVGAGHVDGHQKARLDVSNLPASLAFDLDTAKRIVAFRASTVVERVRAAYVDTNGGPSAVAAVNKVPASVDVNYDLGDRPRVHYKASSAVPRVELFASPQGVEALDPNGHHYLSAAATDIPTEADILVDLPARHLEGVMSASLGGITAVARSPFANRDFVAIAELAGVPAHFDADFTDGTMRFRGLTGPLGSARFAVTNHGGASAPVGQHVSVHYRQLTGDFDGSVLVRNLSHAEYSRGAAQQTTRLDSDTGGQPVFADADVVLAANGVDDTRLALTARIDNLPTKLALVQDLADGKLTYTGDKSIGLTAEVRVGKVKALDGLAAPLFDNGVAVRARGCDDGPGCARQDNPVCTVFARCLGLVGTLRLPGLPTSVAVNLTGKQVEFTGYNQPAGSQLKAYLEIDGLLAGLPRLEGFVRLDGLPSTLDMTVGPITVDGNPARVDIGYQASAPLGTLRVDAEAATSTAYGTLRGRATIAKLPATVHVVGTFDSVTTLGVHNSAPIDEITAALSGVDKGYLSASANRVPKDIDVRADVPASKFTSTLSDRLGGLTFAAAGVPYQGREYQVFAQALSLPTEMEATWAGGSFAFRGKTGAVGSAKFAVTNHAGATAPAGQHVALHYRQANGDLDASASVDSLSLVGVARSDTGVTFDMRSGSGKFAFDGDVVLAANGVDDTRYAGFGRVGVPSHLEIKYADDKFSYHTDRPASIEAEAKIGKVAAINQVGGAPYYPHGVAVEAAACASGAGCAPDETFICKLFGKCFGAVGTVNLPGLPTRVDVDMSKTKIDVVGYHPPAGVDLTAYFRLDGLIDKVTKGSAKAVLRGLTSPYDLHLGPFGFTEPDSDEQTPSTLRAEYDSGPIDFLQLLAEADIKTAADAYTVRGSADVHGVPRKFVLDGSFGKNSHVSVTPSSEIDMINAHVTGVHNGRPASARARLTDVPGCAAAPCVEVDIKGTDGNGNPLQVPIITIDTPRTGMDVEAYVKGHEGLGSSPVYLQLHDVFLKLTNMGTQVRTVVTPGETYVTRFTSTPAATSLIVGGSMSLRTDKIDIPDPNLQLPICDFPDIAFLRLGGHVQVANLDIGKLWLRADNVSSLTLTPGFKYLAFGADGDYSKFEFGATRLAMRVDANIHIRILKFNQDWIPPLFEDRIVLNPADTYTGLDTHVYDQKFGPVAKLEFKLADSPTIYTHTLERIPRVVGSFAPVNGVSGFSHAPDGADHKVVFSLLDPGFPGSRKALIDLATAFKFSPFEKSGDPNEPPCD